MMLRQQCQRLSFVTHVVEVDKFLFGSSAASIAPGDEDAARVVNSDARSMIAHEA